VDVEWGGECSYVSRRIIAASTREEEESLGPTTKPLASRDINTEPRRYL
jgi:hypothetical protein